MQHISLSDRLQFTFGSLEDPNALDDPVRLLDAFVVNLDIAKLSF